MFHDIKKLPLVRLVCKIPGLLWAYHILWAFFGATIYRFPSRQIFVVGVTGTKGKTTTIELLSAILESAGKKTAVLSSLREKIADSVRKNKYENTMPGRFYVQRFFSRAVRAGCKYAIVEVTSEGVKMNRHRFVGWNAGILTGLHPEHIETHGSFERYRKTKLKFLKYVVQKRGRVFINKDDENADFFVKRLSGRDVRVYSKNDKEIIVAFPVDSPVRSVVGGDGFVRSDFNKDNMAAATAVALSLGIGTKTIEGALRGFSGVPGRMEFIRQGGVTAVVDYAHTPDSLRAVYKYLRSLFVVRGVSSASNEPRTEKLICVLGSAGGGRDKWKRPEFGKIAAEYCDEIVLTEDDSYDEKPEDIIKEIRVGISENKRFDQRELAVHEIVNRREAISKAVELAREGDTVVCAGIGSQDVLHRAEGKIPWNEKEVVEEALQLKRRYN